MNARRYGGFDLIRVAAAAAVVVSHSYVIAGGNEPLSLRFGHDEVALGTLAVIVFFATSGYLVSQSYERDPSLLAFAIRRVFRIWPALLAVLAITTIGLVVVSSLGAIAYLTDPATARYAIGNAFVFAAQFELPGVFDSSPNGAVNGSLWTLELEVFAYMLLAGLGATGLYGRRWTIPAVSVGCAIAFTIMRWGELASGPWVAGLPVQDLLKLTAVFMFGAMMTRVRLEGRVALGLVVLTVASQVLPLAPLYLFTVPYVTIWLGTRQLRFASWFRARVGDPSYGMYVWAFPVQQLLWLAKPVHPAILAVEATLLVFVIGVLSWRLVERPATRLGAQMAAGSAAAMSRAAPVPAY